MNAQSLTEKFCRHKIFTQGQLVESSTLDQYLSAITTQLDSTTAPSCYFLQDSNPVRFALTFFSLLDQGHCPIALSPEFHEGQLQGMILNLGHGHFHNGILKTNPQSILPSQYANSYGSLTSGTTGAPKICHLSIAGALENAKGHHRSLGITDEHTIIQCLPLYHSYGLVAYLWTQIQSGCGLDFYPHFLGLQSLEKIPHTKKCSLHLSPSQVQFMLKEKHRPIISAVDIISVGGGLMDTEKLLELLPFFPCAKAYVTYGLTEAGPRVTTGLVEQIKNSGFIGSAIEGVTLKVLTADKILQSSGQGKLCIKTPSCKLNFSAKTENELQEIIEGHLITRDEVLLENQEVYFLGREDDLIKVGGLSVYPADIEHVIMQHAPESIKDCFVFGREDKTYGQRPVAILEAPAFKTQEDKNTLASQLQEKIKTKLSVHQLPREIIIVSEFPRQSLHKINRKALLENITNKN